MISDARKRADLEFKKKMIKQVPLSLHKKNDADVIEFLSKIKNKRQYLINLIRNDMKDKKLD